MADFVMLSKYINKVDEKKLEFPMEVTEKLDGVMAEIYKDNAGTHLRSRQGKPIPSCEHLVSYLEPYLREGQHVIGEIYNEAYLGKFDELSGMIRQEQQPFNGAQFWMFDFYDENNMELLYDSRKQKVNMLYNMADRNVIKVVPYVTLVYNMHELVRVFGAFMKDYPQAEGVVCRPMTAECSKYRTGRSYGFLKLIPEPTVDLRIEEIIEGTGAAKGLCGKIVVTLNDVKLEVGCGKLDHAARKDMLLKPEKYIGRIAEIMYKGKNESGMLRMPRINRLRWDKDTENVEA